jgi:hypothetical protein
MPTIEKELKELSNEMNQIIKKENELSEKVKILLFFCF